MAAVAENAMSTTSSIFNERQINCTILGGARSEKKSVLNVAAILLNSGNSYLRLQNLENLTKCGFEKIVSVENDSKNFNLDDLLQNFPEVKFVIPLEKAADGDLINVAMAEIDSPSALVLRDSIHITQKILTAQLSENLAAQDVFCIAPRIFAQDKTAVPIKFVPGVKKSVLNIESDLQISNDEPTLYPFDFFGFYNTKKFKRLGGYDYSIKKPYWQNLDLAFRAWLWGERIKISTGLSLSYAEEIPLVDSTPDISQLRFFLKNMAPVVKDGRADLPLSKFLPFKARSSCGIFEAFRQFSSARNWVCENERRFSIDAFTLINDWGKI